ncbi:MAG: methyltransferase domain-containing protein [Bacteroidota bacterium]
MISYFPVDLFTEGYKYPEGTINMDITQMEFPENKFDFILCSHVLEHVPNDTLAMSELYRVLKPGGWGILQVPIEMDREQTYEDDSITSPEERKIAFGQFDHVRVYGRDYIKRLEYVGFAVELDDYSIQLSAHDKFRYGFGQGESLFIVRKSK